MLYCGAIFSRVNFSESAAPPTSSGTRIPASRRSRGGGDHLLRAFHQQAGKADGVGLMLLVRADQIFGRNFDAEIHHVVAVVFQDDLDEIFADVVDVALHRGENHLGALFGVGFLHELLEMIDGGLHRFGGLQHFGDDQLVVVEQPADFGHSGHQRAVDDVERGHAFGELAIEIGDEAVLRAFEDVIRQALIERQIFGARFLARAGGAEMFGDGGDVKLIDGGFLLARSARASRQGRREAASACGCVVGDFSWDAIEEQIFGRACARARGSKGSARCARR